MGLVKVHSAKVAKRRHARRCRVLIVDETSLRKRHRYVTVVASGDTGEMPAMFPARTKGSLARFLGDQGPGWCRNVQVVVSDGSRSYPKSPSDATEALNNLVKRIKRAAFGFRNFTNYRIRALFYAGKPN